MAGRKGKSERRIKDWQQRYTAAPSEQFEPPEASRQRFSRKAVKLPPRELAVGAEELNELPRSEGLVLGHYPGGTIVRVGGEVNGDDLLCGIAGTFRAPEGSSPLAVGDVVTVALKLSAPRADGTALDKDRADGMILERQPRRTMLARPEPRSAKRNDPYDTETFEKVIVANMDVLLIAAATVSPPLRHGLIDRFLIIAERGGLRPVLVINKLDLARPDETLLSEFQEMGLEIVLCSAITGEGLDDLTQRLAGLKSVLAGASGVGKTTLINALVPGTDAATRTVRVKDDRGRHTTSSTVIYQLPGGGCLVDTPGVRELGLRLRVNELPWYFPEFKTPSAECKFRDCTHTHEPDCGVIRGVEAGDILPRRYESYVNLLETLEERKRP